MIHAKQREVLLRLMIENPVPGVALSLQDKKSQPVAAQTPGAEPVEFEVSVRVAPKDDGWRLYGKHVRSEGPRRQFFYVGIGEHAGQQNSAFSRRMKIDIHDIAPDLIQQAVDGAELQASIDGTGPDGTPACASIQMLTPWHVG
ncbi:MAG: DUF5990 family protein [Aeromicrobium sp.]